MWNNISRKGVSPLPKRYIVFKWVVYALAALVLLAFQAAVVDHVRLWGLVPWLAPMVVGVVSSYEGSRASPIFALVFGFLLDVGTAGASPGFLTFTFTLSALIAALLAEHLFSPGLLCSLVATAVCYLITALGRLFLYPFADAPLVLSLALGEFLLSLPFLLAVFPLCRFVHRKTTIEY